MIDGIGKQGGLFIGEPIFLEIVFGLALHANSYVLSDGMNLRQAAILTFYSGQGRNDFAFSPSAGQRRLAPWGKTCRLERHQFPPVEIGAVVDGSVFFQSLYHLRSGLKVHDGFRDSQN